jgi:hypothetical protein
MMLLKIFWMLSSLKGGIPTKNSYISTPKDQKSKVLFEVEIPRMISGAM